MKDVRVNVSHKFGANLTATRVISIARFGPVHASIGSVANIIAVVLEVNPGFPADCGARVSRLTDQARERRVGRDFLRLMREASEPVRRSKVAFSSRPTHDVSHPQHRLFDSE